MTESIQLNSRTFCITSTIFSRKNLRVSFLTAIFLTALLLNTQAQTCPVTGCQSGVPRYCVNFVNNPGGTYLSPSVSRNAFCCSASGSDNCIGFAITLDSFTVGLNFEIAQGAVPPGALFYQLDCGTQQQVGNALCLTNLTGNVVTRYLTFCKPGNNQNIYRVTSVPRPIFRDDTVAVGCFDTLLTLGLKDTGATWTSISPGIAGQYDYLLSCRTCTRPRFTAVAGLPSVIQYRVCGFAEADLCLGGQVICDTVSVFITPSFSGNAPDQFVCSPTSTTTLGAAPVGTTWSFLNGPLAATINATTGAVSGMTANGNYNFLLRSTNLRCFDTVTVTRGVKPNAGPDRNVCQPASTVNLGAPPFGLTWSFLSGPAAATINPTTGVVTGLTAVGAYSFVTGAGTTCSDTVVVNLGDVPIICLDKTDILCNNVCSGQIRLSLCNNPAPTSFTAAWSNGSTAINLSDLCTGNYSVTVTTNVGCTATSSIPIQVQSAFSSAINVTEPSINQNNGAIDLNVVGGTAPYTYIWSNFATTQDLTNLGSGLYCVTITDASGRVITNQVNLASAGFTARGSIIVDMGITPQTIGNGLKPYGLLYDLVGNYDVPVKWVIASNKRVDPLAVTPRFDVDFTVNGYNYKGGPFVIDSDYLSPTVRTRLAFWQTQGVQLDTLLSDVNVPVYQFITSFPITVIDQDNENLVTPYYTNAGIPNTSYTVGLPLSLDACDDVYALPHADPTWTTHSNLRTFNLAPTRGFIWSGCHAVSVLEGIFNPSNTSQRMNFLSTNGLQCFNSGDCGTLVTETHAGNPTLPLSYDSLLGSEPIMQIMGDMTPSMDNGSEKWYIPLTTGAWRSTTKTAIRTADAAGTVRQGVKLAYGPGYGDSNNGLVMYQAGHTSDGKGSVANQVAFQRSYFNFLLTTGVVKRLNITPVNIPGGFYAGVADTLSILVTGGSGVYTYQWTSTCGGNFGSPNSATTTFILPSNTPVNSRCIIKCRVQDNCGRVNFYSKVITTVPAINPVRYLSSTITNSNCFGQCNGSITGAGTGGTSPYTYLWNTGATTATISNLCAGLYSVTTTDAIGCQKVDTIRVNQPDTIAASFNITQPQCSPLTTGAITTTITGGTAPYTYLWNGGQTTANRTGLAAGTYTLTVTDSKGCSKSFSVTVTNVTTYTTTASNTGPYCAGQTIQLNSTTAGTTYSWSGPSGFTSGLQNPTRPSSTTAHSGVYSITVTNAVGCTASSSTTVTVNAVPSAPSGVAASPSPACAGGTLTLTATGTALQWTFPDLGSASGSPVVRTNITTAMSGTYSVTQTVSGCVSLPATVNATINPLPVIGGSSSINPTTCGGTNGSVTLTGLAASTTYAVTYTGPSGSVGPVNITSSAGGNVVISNLSAGSYSNFIVTLNGCPSAPLAGPITLQDPTTPSAPTGLTSSSPLCSGQTLTLSAQGQATAKFRWTGPVSFLDSCFNTGCSVSRTNATTAMSGTYSVVQIVNNCTSTPATISVTVNQTPSISGALGTGPTTCLGSSGFITISGLANNTTYTVNYSKDGSPQPQVSRTTNGSGALTIIGLTAGSYSSFTVSVNGCTSPTFAGPVLLQDPVSPSVTAGSSSSSYCSGQTIQLTSTPSGGTGPYTYSWSGPSTYTASIQNPTRPSSTTAHSGVYLVTVTDANSCTAAASTANITVFQTPAVTASSTSTSYCIGGTIQLNANPTGGSSPYSYTWSGPSGFSAFVQTPSRSNAQVAHSGIYNVTVTSNDGCSASASTAAITVSQALTINIGSNSPACTGGTLSLNSSVTGGTSPITYTWSGPLSFSSNAQNPSRTNVVAGFAGNYLLTVTDANNCSNTSSTNVVVNTGVSVTPSSNSPVCVGNTLSLTGTPTGGTAPYSYTWSGPSGYSASGSPATRTNVQTTHAGTYNVTITDATGCSGTGSTNVVINTNPTITASSNTPVCSGATISLSSTPSGGSGIYSTYAWSGPLGFTAITQNTTRTSALTSHSGVYNVTVTDNSGCTASATTSVTVNPSPTVSAGSNSPVCETRTINLTSSPSGGNGSYTYAWSGPAGYSASTQNPTRASAISTFGGVYAVTVTDGNGCSATASTSVTILPKPSAPTASASPNPVCIGQTLNLSGTGSGSATWNWFGPNAFTSNLQNPSISSVTTSAAGTYSLFETLSGCSSDTATVTVIVNVTPSAPVITSLVPNPVCTGQSVTLTASGSGGATFNWTGPNGYTSSTNPATIASAVLTNDGNYTVTQTITGCTSAPSSPVNLVVNQTPTAPTPTSNSLRCYGDTLKFFASTVAGASYAWSGPGGFTSSDQNPVRANAVPTMSGVYSLTVTVTGCPSTNAATVSATVTSCPPIAQDDNYSTNEDTPLNVSAPGVLVNDNDPANPQQPLTVTTTPVSGPSNGTLTLNANGSFTYNPNTNFNGTDNFCYRVCDNEIPAACDTACVTITVVPVNDPPVVKDSTVTTPEDVPITVCLPITDPETLTQLHSVTLCGGPANGTLSGTLGVNNGTNPHTVCFTYTPNLNYNGTDQICLIVCDNASPVNGCDTATVTINVTPVNDKPIAVDDYFTNCVGSPISGDVLINDSDVDGPFVTALGTLSGPNGGTLTLSPTGAFTYNPPLPSPFNGIDSFTYVICDGGSPNLCDTAVAIIDYRCVNVPPIANNDAYSTNEDQTLIISAPGVLANDIDPDGGIITLTTPQLTGPSHGTLTLNANGSFTYVPSSNYNGPDTFSYVICDNGSPIKCDTALVFITVNPVNDPPFVPDTVLTNCEDCPPLTVCIPISDVETDQDYYVAGAVCGPNSGTYSTTVNNVTNVLCVTYTSNANFNGLDSLCLVVCDNGIPNRCDTTKIRITIDPVNDPPVANNDSYTTNEDTPLNISAPGVLSNDSDPLDGTAVSVFGVVSGPSNGTLTLNANGSFTYTPNANFNGTDNFCYRITDSGTPSPFLLDTACVTITVNQVNDPPFIPDTTVTTCEDCPITVCLPITDAEVGTQIYSASICGVPANGSITTPNVTQIPAQVCVTYTPNSNFNGTNSICLIVCDNGLPVKCDTSTITITVIPVNDPPVANNDSYSTNEDTPLNISAPGVLSNDSDPADGTTVTVVGVISGPSNGVLTLNANGSFSYTPNANFNGIDAFCYAISDSGTPPPFLLDTACVTINVISVNDPPIVQDSAVTTPEDNPITVCLTITDEESATQQHIVTICDAPNNGTLTFGPIVNNGSIPHTVCFTYTPNANFNGADTLCLTVCDNGVPFLCDNAVVIINVTPVNDPPVANNDSYTTNEDTPLNISAPGVLSNDSDPIDGTAVSVVGVVSGPSNGVLTLNANGSFTYIPNAGFNGTDNFCYRITDSGTPSPFLLDTACVTITVNQVNDPPFIPDTTVTTCEDCPITLCIPYTDADTADLHSAANLCAAQNGSISSVSVNQTLNVLCFTYTPYLNINGLDSMCFVLCDNGSPISCDTTKIKINVFPVNDPPYADTIYVVTYENQPIGVNVASATGDVEGNPLTYSYGSVTPGGGSYGVTGNGAIVVIPNPGFTGTFTIPYGVCDLSPYLVNVLCDNAAIIVTVLPSGDTLVNHAPVANNDYVTTPRNTSVVVNQLANDYDPDGDALQVTVTDAPNNGTYTVNANGSINYTPNTGFFGYDTIAYTICDPSAQNLPKPLCDNAIVVIYVSTDSTSITNDPPVAVDDFAFICSDATTTLRLLLNDSDPNGNALTSVSIIDNVNNGTLTSGSLGIYLYDPNNGFNGNDTLIYRVCDNGTPSLCDTAIAVIQVSGNPVITPSVSNLTICSGDSVKINFSSNIPSTVITWTATNGTSGVGNIATTLSNVSNGTQTVIYNVVGVAPGGCGSTVVSIPVTIKSKPVPTFAANGTIFCSGDNVVINVSSNVVNTTYSWSSSLGASGTGSIISDNPVNSGTSNITVTYTIIPVTSGCTGDTLLVPVTVKPRPVLTVNPSSQTVCSGTPITITIGTSIAGTTFNWTGSNSSSGNTSPISDSPINPSAAPIVITYNVNGLFNGCAANNVSATVTVRPAVVANAGADVNAVSCQLSCVNLGGSPTGSGGGGGLTYTWTPATGLSSATASNPTACNLASTTTYTVVVRDAFNCNASDQVIVNITPSNLTAEAGAGGAICGTGDSIRLGGIPTAVGGNAPYTYTWSPLTGLNLTNQANPDAKPTTTTKYFVTVTDQFGCTSVDSTTVFVNAPLVVNAGADSTICNGQSLNLGGAPTASGGNGTYTYQWNPSTFLSSGVAANPVANPSGTVTYFLTVTDGNGCTVSDFVTITVRPTPSAFAGADKSLYQCPGDSVVLGDIPAATGGVPPYSYSWSPSIGIVSATNIANPIVKGLVSNRTYTLLVTDANGCTATDAVTVNSVASNILTYAAADKEICFGNCVNLGSSPTVIGGVPGYIYKWSNGQSLNDSTIANPSACPSGDVNYSVTVTDSKGCTATDAVFVKVNPNPDAITGNDTSVCLGNAIVIGSTPAAVGGTPPYVYAWTPTLGVTVPNLANPSVAPLVNTTYSLLVTDSKGCKGGDDVLVTVRSRPVVDAGSDKSIVACAKDTAFMLVNVTGGTSPYSFNWTPATALSSSTVQNPYVTGLTTTTSYQVLVSDSFGCQGVDFIIVNVLPSTLQADAGNSNNICSSAGTPVNIGGNPTAVGGTSPYVYTWGSSPAGFSSSLSNPVVSPLVSTTYYVTVTDSKGCTSVDSVRVNLSPAPSANAGSDTALCQGFCAQIGGLPAGSGGTAPLQYAWTPTVGLNANNVANPIACPLVTTTYIVQVTDSNGCVATDQVVVSVRPLPIANAGADKSLVSCGGDSVQIGGTPASSGGTGALTCSWTPANGLSSASICNPFVSGITTSQLYTLAVTDANGCRAEDAVLVSVVPSSLTAEAGINGSICAGSGTSVVLGASPTAQGGTAPYSYNWSPSASLNLGNPANPIATPSVTTKYFVTVTDAKGCIALDSVTITVTPTPVACAGPDTAICAGAKVFLGCLQTGSGGSAPYSYIWSNGSTSANPLVDVTATTIFTVTVTDANGCTASDSKLVTVNPNPNADAGADKTLTSCSADSVQIGGSPSASGGTSPYTYSWLPLGSLSSNTIANPWVKGLGSTKTYNLVVTDVNGCFDNDQVAVVVNNPALQAEAGNDVAFCADAAVSITLGGAPTAQGTTPPYTYTWTSNPAGFSASTANPTVSPAVTTTYFVGVQDGNGCQAFDSVRITINPRPVVNAGLSDTICAGACVVLGGQPTASGGSGTNYTYNWTPSFGLNFVNVANPVACPTGTITYQVTATDSLGCSNTSNVTIRVNQNPTANGGGPFSTVACTNACVIIGGVPTATGGTAPYLYAWSPAAGLNNTGLANPAACNLSQNVTYRVTVTDINGCTASANSQVNVSPSTLAANAGPDKSICAGQPNCVSIGAANAVTGGTAPYSIDWSPVFSICDFNNVQNPTVNPTDTTTYVLLVQDALGCIAVDSMVLYANPAVTAIMEPDTAICAGGVANLGGNPNTAGGGTAPFTYSWSPSVGLLSSPNIANPAAAPAVSTVYCVTVTDAVGCSSSACQQVLVNPGVVADAGNPATVVSCSGAFHILGGSPTGSGGSGNYIYAWSPSTVAGVQVLNGTTLPNPIITGLTQSTVFTLTVTDNVSGCSGTDSVLISVVPTTLTVDAGSNKVYCANSNFCVQIGGSPTAQGGAFPYIYQWAPIAGLNDPTIANPCANPINTTTYLLTVTDNNGCNFVDSVTVIVSPLIVANAGLDSFLCSGSSITLGANPTGVGGTGVLSYNWSAGAFPTNAANPTVSPIANTTYSVTVTDALGCSASDAMNVVLRQRPVANAGPDAAIFACALDTAVLGGNPTGSGTQGPYTYLWNNPTAISSLTAANPFATNLGNNQIYCVVVTDAFGCQSLPDCMNLTANPPLIFVNAGANSSLCSNSGGCVVLSGTVTGTGVAPFTYAWSGGPLSNTNTLNTLACPLNTTTYTLLVTDVNGCASSDTTVVTVNNPPVASIAGLNANYCANAGNITLTGVPSGGVFSGPFVTGNIFQASVAGAGQWCIKYTYQDPSTGCIDDTTICVTVNPLPNVTIGLPSASLCAKDPIQTLTGSPAGGVFSGPGITGNQFNPSLANIGNNTITYTYFDPIAGCGNTATVVINVKENPQLNITASLDSVCVGQSTTLTATYSLDVFNIVWRRLGGPVIASGFGPITINPSSIDPTAVDFCVVATAINTPNGCSTSDTICLHINQNPVALADTANTCEEQAVNIAVLVNDTDPEGNAGVVTVLSATNGTTTVNNGVITYSPAVNYNGVATITYQVCNAACLNACDTATVTVNVCPVNDPPVVNNPVDTIYEDQVSVLCAPADIIVTDVDAGDSYTYTLIPCTTVNGTATENDTCVTFDPATGWTGTQVLCIAVCDTSGACDTGTITIVVLPINKAPIAQKINVVVCENTAIGINVGAACSDPDGDPMTFSYSSVLGAPNGANYTFTSTGNGTVLFNSESAGTYNVFYVVCDTSAIPQFQLCDTNQILITVVECDTANNPPVANDDAVVSNVSTPIVINELANDFDPDGDPLNVTIISGPSLNGATASVNNDGTISYNSPTEGVDSIQYVICDPNAACDTAWITIFIDFTSNTNHPPLATDDHSTTNYLTPIAIDITKNDSDPDGNSLVVGPINVPCPPQFGTTSIVGNVVTYVPGPLANANQPDTFCYVICDVANPVLCDTAVVVVYINNSVQGVPECGITGSFHTTTIDVLSNDFDPENDSFYVSSVIPMPITIGSVTLNNDGTITYVPNPDTCGFVDSFQYVIVDVQGATDTVTVCVDVICCPRPDAVNDAVVTVPGVQIAVNILANDTSFGQGPLTADILPGGGPQHGTVFLDTARTVFYTPDSGWCGFDTITYFVETRCGLDTATLVINTFCNTPPIANADTFTVCTNTVTDFKLLSNDADSTSSVIFITGTSVAQPTTLGGVTGQNATNVQFTSLSLPGTATFTYVVCDDGPPSLCDTGSVVVIIRTCEPISVDTIIDTTFINTPDTICIAGYVDADAPWVITSLCEPLNGTVEILPGSQCFVYTPDQNFVGIDTFCLVACDTFGNCDTTPVIIYVIDTTIFAVDEPCEFDSTKKNTAITIDILANDQLPWAGDTIVTIPSTVPNATVVLNANNTVTVTPATDFVGSINFSYEVCVITGPYVYCDTANVCVTVYDSLECFLPNGFSPNGDGVNDEFVIPCKTEYPDASLIIYNRWGVEVWNSEGPYQNNFKGENMQGVPLPDGTYYFLYYHNDGTGDVDAKFVVIHR